MKAELYLVVQGQESRYLSGQIEMGTVRVTKKKPHTAKNEIALCLQLDIPDALFMKPTLQARVTVPESGGYGPVIDAEVADNIAAIIREQTGFSVHVSAGDPDGQ